MSRTLVDIDDDALAEAMKEYQAQTKVEVDAVNRALREVAERRARRLGRAFAVWDETAADMAAEDWSRAWRRGE